MTRTTRTATGALNSWATRRLELLQTRVCDLHVTLDEGPYVRAIERVRSELERRGVTWFPRVYLSTGWHCPDRVPVVGVPFALASSELRRLEREVTGHAETQDEMARLLRHEVGHAVNYRFKFHESAEWREHFGPISTPYRDAYDPSPRSRRFVRHLPGHYAQKHPDEDFAETFAVWLTPRARWRRQYRGWGALDKLELVDRLMADVAGVRRAVVGGPRLEPIEQVTVSVARFYERAGHELDWLETDHEQVAYFDDDLRSAVSGPRTGGATSATTALRRLRGRIVSGVVEQLGVRQPLADRLFDKYEQRAGELGLSTARSADDRLLVALTSMMSRHVVNRQLTGRFPVSVENAPRQRGRG